MTCLIRLPWWVRMRAGFALYFVLVSWLYALYSFDYRWALARQRLPERIALFQTHSAFFLGARSPSQTAKQRLPLRNPRTPAACLSSPAACHKSAACPSTMQLVVVMPCANGRACMRTEQDGLHAACRPNRRACTQLAVAEGE